MKIMRKNAIVGIAVMCALSTAATAPINQEVFADTGEATTTTNGVNVASSPQIIIDGSTLVTTVAPYIKYGTTMVPLRAISEYLGASVEWDAATRSIHIEKDLRSIDLTVGEVAAKVNGEYLTAALAPEIVSGSTMVPLRFIGEALNCSVSWDGTTKTVTIESGEEFTASEEQTDAYGRTIRTTNLPTNADEFPYIVEGIPNWVYEAQTNIRKNNIWGAGGFMDNDTKEIVSKGGTAATLAAYGDYELNPINLKEGLYELACKFVDLQTNIDYTTLDESWVNEMLSCFSASEVASLEKAWVNDPITTMRDSLLDYINYYKKYKIQTTCEYEVLPETVWVDYLGLPHFSVYVKFTVTNSEYDGNLQDLAFGMDWIAMSDEDANSFAGYETGQTYEAVITYTLTRDRLNNNEWKIDYTSCDFDLQILPSVDVLKGVKPMNRDSNRIQNFWFWYMDVDQDCYATRYDAVNNSYVTCLTH